MIILLQSCENDDGGDEPTLHVLNSFEMTLNGALWKPSLSSEDECLQTFHCEWWQVTRNGEESPIYTVRAFRDPKARTNVKSENIFRFQISNVSNPGSYTVSGAYREDFSSYALLIINTSDGTSVRFVNSVEHSSFFVTVDDFIPVAGSSLEGIRGSFSGTLYNEQDPLDSLIIQKGAFIFKKINQGNYDHCPF